MRFLVPNVAQEYFLFFYATTNKPFRDKSFDVFIDWVQSPLHQLTHYTVIELGTSLLGPNIT